MRIGRISLALVALAAIMPCRVNPSFAGYADKAKYQSLMKSLSNEKNYVSALEPDNTDTWSVAQPIKVYVHPSDGIAGYSPTYLDRLKDALKAWTEASNGQINLTLVDKPSADGIDITWKARPPNSFKNHTEGGITYIFPGVDGIKRSTIDLYTFPNADHNRMEIEVTVVCLHELGHALGVQGHSPVGTDIMCADYNITKDHVPGDVKLTDRDKNTILAILQLGPRSSDTDLINAACKDIIEGQFEKAIKELEESLRINPADKLAASNLEIAYTNYAGKLYADKNYAQAAPILERLAAMLTHDTKKQLQVLGLYAFCLEQTGNESEAAKTRATIEQLSATLPKAKTNGNAKTKAKTK